MRGRAFFFFLLLTLAGGLGAATITGFSPASGQPGSIITIAGTGLSGTTLVEFNANNPVDADFETVSGGIQAIVPIGATTGPLSLTVAGATLITGSNFVVAPVISGFSPPSGNAGTTVAVFGANFTAGATVKFTGATAVVGTLVADSQIDAAVPAGTTSGPITVTTSLGSAVSTNSFIVSSAPVITDFSPTSGTNGSTVVIDGANFIDGGTTVKFTGASASASVTFTATTQLHTVVPAGATSGPITLSTANGTFVTSSNFITGAGILITAFDPTYGKAGTTVNLTGVGLLGSAPISTVKFNGTTASGVTSDMDTAIQVAVPTGATTGKISVSDSKGSFTTVSNFTVVTAPFVTGFSPAIGPVGAQVVLTGVDFTGVTTVSFNGKTAAASTPSDTQITTTVPSGATTGPIAVAGVDTSSNFVVTTDAPYITSFTPTNAVQGESVIVNGANFMNLPTPAVRIGGVAASNEPVTATTQLIVIVPSNAVTGYITVSNSSGGGVSPSMLYLQPWITNFTPVGGFVYSNLTIIGRNFTNASSVSVGGVNYNFTASANKIVAAVPTNALAGPVVVTTPGGVVISTNNFAVLPNIFGFSPDIGPPNTLVRITGTSLSNVTSVLFGGGTPVAPSSVSFDLVTAVVPSNAVTGPITIYTPVGNATTVSNFVVTQGSEVDLTKTANQQILAPGADVTYTLALTNIGPSIITTVVVTDSLPSGLSYVSGSCSAGAVTYTNPIVYWSMPALTNRTVASATIVATASVASRFDNIAGVSFGEEGLSGGYHVATSVVYFVTATARTLAVAHTGSNLILSWPQTGLGFDLQFNTNLDLPSNWTTVNPVLVNGTNYVTNSVGRPAEFFRLETP